MSKDRFFKFLKQILSFLKKIYPKPIICILLLVFLISSYISYQATKNDILKLEETIFTAKKTLTEKDKEIEPRLEEFNTLGCSEEFIDLTGGYFLGQKVDKYRKEYGEEKFLRCKTLGEKLYFDFNTHNYILENIQKNEQELQELKERKQAPFYFFRIPFAILISLILVLPILIAILRGLVLFTIDIKKQVVMMTTFQKYLLVLLFCILIISILILLKLF